MFPGSRLLLRVACLCACLSVGSSAPSQERPLEVSSVPGEEVSLPCPAPPRGVPSTSVHWYKGRKPSEPLRSSPDLPDGVTRRDRNVSQEVALQGHTRSISLPNVTCQDAGVYTCQLLAPAGEQNQEGHVHLVVAGCPEETTDSDSLVILASVMLIVAFGILLLSYVCLRNTIRGRKRKLRRQVLLTAPLAPLEPADLRLISTLGAKPVRKPPPREAS